MTRLEKFGLSDRQEEIKKELQERLHLRLEERVDERALLEPIPARHIKAPRNLPVIRLLGLQQEPGNRLVWRKHWFGMLITTFPAFIFTLLSLAAVLTFALNPFHLSATAQFTTTGISILITGIALFTLWWRWEDWANDRYIVSDQLIERIIKKPLWFDEDRTTLSLERVQNVEFNRPSPLAFLLNYGDVHIQTAASDGKVVFSFVPAPDEVQFEIFHRIKDYQENMEKRRQSEQKNDFVEWLEAYHKLASQGHQT
jgi:membrane protein YdbS with pleckstrin-like domain